MDRLAAVLYEGRRGCLDENSLPRASLLLSRHSAVDLPQGRPFECRLTT
jgi:hypothetical protein